MVNAQLIPELRLMFKQGATPSRLIRYIVSKHKDAPNRRSLIQEYFREAFSTPLVRIADPNDDYDPNDLRFWSLNIHLIHQILESRSKWDSSPDASAVGEMFWLDSLDATDETRLIDESHPATIPELKHSWGQLDEGARNYIQRVIGNTNALHERVLILARLAECLQQQIVEFETLKTPSPDRPAPAAIARNSNS